MVIRNFYDLTPLRKYTPETVVRYIKGSLFDKNYNPVTKAEANIIINELKDNELCIKPSIESGGGKDVWIGKKEDAANKINSINSYDYVIQKIIYSNNELKKLNPSSLNTLRCMTVFTGTEHKVVGITLRIGRSKSRVDNQNSGGVVVGVNENGTLFEFGLDKNLNKYFNHPDTGIKFSKFNISSIAEVRTVCKEMHKFFPHFGLISWDVAIDAEGNVRIIEMNLDWQSINMIQYHIGPLFGDMKGVIINQFSLPDWSLI